MDTNSSGAFKRSETQFRNWVKGDQSTPYPVESGRYHLYLSYACPWASRTLMVRNLRKLEKHISISVVDPVWGANGWKFGDDPEGIEDSVNHARDLIEIYRKVDPHFKGEETVPILWDKKTSTIVNNESREIIRMLDVEFHALGDSSVNLCPDDLRSQIDFILDDIYEPINNGVYRAGFARTQNAYEKAVKEVFAALESYELLLGRQRYLCGSRLTEADVCLFTTLVRFDSVYVGHFKCNVKCLREYPNLWAYTRDVYQTLGVADTVNFRHIKEHYHRSHEQINPLGIVPVGPVLDFWQPHDRARLMD